MVTVFNCFGHTQETSGEREDDFYAYKNKDLMQIQACTSAMDAKNATLQP